MDYRKLGLFVLFWLILAQTLSFERIAIGTLICVAVYLFNKDLQSFNQKNRNLALPNLKFLLSYITVLIVEMFKSNFHVAKIILSPKLNISTSIVTINTKLKNEFNKTVLANSITLTPGTLTLDSTNDKLIIHCLDKEVAKGLENSKFEQMLLKKEELFND
jgi:multicomponent Na+:H+ antiporter subunit E